MFVEGHPHGKTEGSGGEPAVERLQRCCVRILGRGRQRNIWIVVEQPQQRYHKFHCPADLVSQIIVQEGGDWGLGSNVIAECSL